MLTLDENGCAINKASLNSLYAEAYGSSLNVYSGMKL